MPPAREAPSNGLPSILPVTPASHALSRCPDPPSGNAHNGIFQRYVSHLPAAGEIVLFDRSWHNRAGVEKVMVLRGRRVPKVFASVAGLRTAAHRRRNQLT